MRWNKKHNGQGVLKDNQIRRVLLFVTPYLKDPSAMAGTLGRIPSGDPETTLARVKRSLKGRRRTSGQETVKHSLCK